MNKKYFIISLTLSIFLSFNLAFADDTLFDNEDKSNVTTNTIYETEAISTNDIVQNSQNNSTNTTVQMAQNLRKSIILKIGSNIAKTNNGDITMQNPAEVIDQRLYLPLRFVSENILETVPKYDSSTKEIIISKEQTEIKLYLNSKNAVINGQSTQIENAPIIKNSLTLLPVKFFTQHFELDINYNAVEKSITISEKSKDLNPPVADFELSKTEFIQGETISFADKSSDMDGDSIVKLEFTLKETNTVSSDINKLFSKISAGNYTLMYRVMNNKNTWSDYVEKNIVILENKAPQILNLRTTKTSIARGEEFDIVFDYENENFEQIVDTIWTYRYHDQDISKAKNTKPSILFTEGNYIITLQLKDAYGNLSDVSTLNIKVSSKVVQTQLQYLAEKDITNTSLENYKNTNYLNMFKPIDIQLEDNNKILIMSDSPENVFSYGVLYQDTVDATYGRILTYHVNKLSKEQSNGAGIVVLAENLDIAPITFSLEQTGMKGPSPDPHEVGGKVLETHFEGLSPWSDTIINPNDSKIIYDSRKALNWKPNHLISMLSEFQTSGRTKITVLSVGPNTKISDMKMLPALQRDQHPRGTFSVTERLMAIDTPRWDAMSVILGKNDNEWIVGKDGITNLETINKGNYGIEYRITITPKEDTLVILNCRGGAFRGFIGWNDGAKKIVSSYGPHDARYVGKLEANKPATIRYMLPNGSASPVQIGFLPKSTWHR